MLRSLGPAEASEACRDGLAEVHCDFCGQAYRFEPTEIADLFSLAVPNAPGSGLLQ
jgi:molecular chaperone Hsp33